MKLNAWCASSPRVRKPEPGASAREISQVAILFQSGGLVQKILTLGSVRLRTLEMFAVLSFRGSR